MGCLKNLLHSAANLAKIAASRLMFTIGFKSDANHARRSTAIPARKSTTLFVIPAQKRLGLETTGLKNAQSVPSNQSVKPANANMKSKITSTAIIVLKGAATYTKRSCISVTITWLRWKEMAINAVSVVLNGRLMSTILTCLGDSKSLTEKGATTI